LAIDDAQALGAQRRRDDRTSGSQRFGQLDPRTAADVDRSDEGRSAMQVRAYVLDRADELQTGRGSRELRPRSSGSDDFEHEVREPSAPRGQGVPDQPAQGASIRFVVEAAQEQEAPRVPRGGLRRRERMDVGSTRKSGREDVRMARRQPRSILNGTRDVMRDARDDATFGAPQASDLVPRPTQRQGQFGLELVVVRDDGRAGMRQGPTHGQVVQVQHGDLSATDQLADPVREGGAVEPALGTCGQRCAQRRERRQRQDLDRERQILGVDPIVRVAGAQHADR
tara:strand:- start:7430 stop:8278 length:849 start_codon:yes stop_codon:yes gene_type:complete